MTLDALDQAFVDLWNSRPAAGGSGSTAATTAPVAAPAPAAAQPTAAIASSLESDDLIDRLLLSGRDQWATLADEIEAARLAGHRVIAITGGERGEGRSTLALCLARTLEERGREVALLGQGDAAAGDAGRPAGGGHLHDKRIVLVDAGVWFRPGPIRRQRLAVASLGCDAVILVRRADRPPAPAWATAVAAVGVTVVGEVLTFAPATRPAEPADVVDAEQEADQ